MKEIRFFFVLCHRNSLTIDLLSACIGFNPRFFSRVRAAYHFSYMFWVFLLFFLSSVYCYYIVCVSGFSNFTHPFCFLERFIKTAESRNGIFRLPTLSKCRIHTSISRRRYNLAHKTSLDLPLFTERLCKARRISGHLYVCYNKSIGNANFKRYSGWLFQKF